MARRFDTVRPVIEVSRTDQTGWIIKQPASADRAQLRALDHEAAFYDLVHATGVAKPLRQLVPRLSGYDRAVHGLVLERKPLLDCWRALCTDGVDSRLCAEAIGRAFAVLHATDLGDLPQGGFLPRHQPWLLSLVNVAASAIDEQAARSAMEVIRSDGELSRGISNLAREWQSDTLIHGDAKLENALWDPANQAVWLIDWGLVDGGDASWDLGGVVQSALALWVSGMAFDGEDVAEVVQQGSFDYADIIDVISSFLRAYRSACPPSDWEALRLKTVRMAGARLVQTAFEHARTGQTLMRRHVAMLRLAKALLLRPRDFPIQA